LDQDLTIKQSVVGALAPNSLYFSIFNSLFLTTHVKAFVIIV
jgi:hypothetical protein